MKHSTWAVPKWREGDILHPVQVTREARQVGGGGSWGRVREGVGTVWTIETFTKGRGGGRFR